jgi:hypothetical protein
MVDPQVPGHEGGVVRVVRLAGGIAVTVVHLDRKRGERRALGIRLLPGRERGHDARARLPIRCK